MSHDLILQFYLGQRLRALLPTMFNLLSFGVSSYLFSILNRRGGTIGKSAQDLNLFLQDINKLRWLFIKAKTVALKANQSDELFQEIDPRE